jgi:hypothetical protein
LSASLSLYALEPGTPDVPASSATGVFIGGILRLLEEAEGLEVRTRWLRARPSGGGGRREMIDGSRWMGREIARLLRDRSHYLIFIYPQLPLLAHVEDPALLAAARRVYQALRARCRLTRQRIIVLVEHLPIEQARGREIAGGPAARIDEKRVRAIESTLFRGAYRLIAPEGLAEALASRYRVPARRLRTFRRNIYLTGVAAAQDPPLEFDSGTVNFFYSGSVDPHIAPNFREMLRAIRNAPDTRLHVCGPGRDAVREWLAELDVPNVRHHGRLGVAEHDWLAGRCDIGLILYPTDNPYYHLIPTMKYSAYLANGLAVLSTDLRRVAENIRADGVGQAMPIRELAMELLRWATRPNLWIAAKENAEARADVIRSGAELRPFIEELARGR